MADFFEVKAVTDEIDHVVRRASGGFVDEEYSVCFHKFFGRPVTGGDDRLSIRQLFRD
jgi:hypothetical protein